MSQHAASNTAGDRFLSASAVYYCDLAHEGKPRLLLAHLVELIHPPYSGLGLKARTRLSRQELACMDGIGRRLLARPFDYLHAECMRVRCSASPGCAIAALSASHHAALKIAPPRQAGSPPALTAAQGDRSATTVMAGLNDMIRDTQPLDGEATIETFCQEL